MTITATLTADSAGRAIITATGGTLPYRVYGYTTSNRWLVRAVPIVTGSSSKHVDSDAHLNSPLYYDIYDATNTKLTVGPLVVASDTSILTDALYPGIGMRVNVISQKPNTWEAKSQWFDILGRRDPLPVIAPLRYRSGTIKLRAIDGEDRAGIVDMLSSGRPLLLRMAVHDMAADDVFMLVTRVVEDPVLDTYHSGPAVFSIDYQAVTRDIGPEWTNARTYATITTESATYAVFAAAWTSYQTAAGGVLP